jgi:hypothetical protein
MKFRIFRFSALVAVAIIVLAIAFLARKTNDSPQTTARTSEKATPEPEKAPAVTATNEPKGVIEEFLDRLQKRQVTPAQLLAFRKALLEADPATVIPAIRAFLATGKDISTGLAFELGEGGEVTHAPTLRLLLLDVLGQLSRKARTADAATVAREILAEKKSSDEWAIALRNLAWHEPQSTAFLASKFSEMVRNEAWRTQPSSAFLEAFDVAVFSKQVTVMEPLDEALQAPNPELQRAAAVALDRLAESAPLEVMQKLNSEPQLFAEHPLLRADWFAKADLREPAQRAAFETYLARTDVTLEEKSKALKALASPGQFISDNLLTTPLPPGDDDARDAAVLGAANDWSRRFPQLETSLASLRERLGR